MLANNTQHNKPYSLCDLTTTNPTAVPAIVSAKQTCTSPSTQIPERNLDPSLATLACPLSAVQGSVSSQAELEQQLLQGKLMLLGLSSRAKKAANEPQKPSHRQMLSISVHITMQVL